MLFYHVHAQVQLKKTSKTVTFNQYAAKIFEILPPTKNTFYLDPLHVLVRHRDDLLIGSPGYSLLARNLGGPLFGRNSGQNTSSQSSFFRFYSIPYIPAFSGAN
jgi:hypothetical protein